MKTKQERIEAAIRKAIKITVNADNIDMGAIMAIVNETEKPANPLTPTNEHKGRLCYFWDGERPENPFTAKLSRILDKGEKIFQVQDREGDEDGLICQHADLLTGLFLRPHDGGECPVDDNPLVLVKYKSSNVPRIVCARSVIWANVTGYLTEEDLKNAQLDAGADDLIR